MTSFVSGCCDSKIYKLKSNTSLDVGNIISLNPNNFCYTAIEEPSYQTPYSTLDDDLGFLLLTGVTGCTNAYCMPCTSYSGTSTTNECNVITLLDLGVECVSINPTVLNPNSGVLSVSVTGGTAPYTIIWKSPNGETYTGQTIYNKPVGTYTVTVYDKWKDFTVTQECVLEIIIDCTFSGSVTQFYTPTATPTPTPTPTPTLTPTATPAPTPTSTPTPTPTSTGTSCSQWYYSANYGADTLNYTDCNGNVVAKSVEEYESGFICVLDSTPTPYWTINISGNILAKTGYPCYPTTTTTTTIEFIPTWIYSSVTISSSVNVLTGQTSELDVKTLWEDVNKTSNNGKGYMRNTSGFNVGTQLYYLDPMTLLYSAATINGYWVAQPPIPFTLPPQPNGNYVITMVNGVVTNITDFNSI